MAQRLRQASFQAGTLCVPLHTARWQASVHASTAERPHTVTQVLGVGSCAREAARRA